MTSIDIGRMPAKIAGAAVLALCTIIAASPAPAQEPAPASGGHVPRGGGDATDPPKAPPDATVPTSRDIAVAPPRHAPAGLWRRANVRALIANAPNRAAGLPPANIRIQPLPLHTGIGAVAPRNAIGATTTPGHDRPAGAAGFQGGARLIIVGPAARNGGYTAHQTIGPANGLPALHGATINGTTMGRIASGPGSIGGPAKDRSGINGTSIRPKH